MIRNHYFVLGYFGYENNKLDGQTIKTRSIFKLFQEKSTKTITYFDTERIKQNKFNALLSIAALCRSKEVIYIPAHNNLKYFFIVLYYLSKVFNFKIHYFVIGGWLPKFLQDHKKIALKLKKIERIYPETNQMIFDLETSYQINNTAIFPNFRFNVSINPHKSKNKDLKLVFMSRIIKNKGIEMIIEFAKQTNIDLTIDFYGQINPNIKVFFNSSLNTCAKINYKGYLQPEIINEVLAQYDVLLLPTKFYTEGLPGAIVDAYFSGIPVIVTRWLHAEEFVIHEKTGFIIPFEQGENDFKYYIEKLHNDRKLLDLMKTNARNESLKFTSDVAWQNFKKINKQ